MKGSASTPRLAALKNENASTPKLSTPKISTPKLSTPIYKSASTPRLAALRNESISSPKCSTPGMSFLRRKRYIKIIIVVIYQDIQ